MTAIESQQFDPFREKKQQLTEDMFSLFMCIYFGCGPQDAIVANESV